MGFDKQLLNINGKSIFESNLEILKGIFDEIIVVTSKPELYNNFDVKVVSDIYLNCGPLGGIHAGLQSLNDITQYAYLLACDMPCINKEFVDYLIKQTMNNNYDACVSTCDGKMQPFNGIYSKSILPIIESDLSENKTSLYKLIKKVNAHSISEEIILKFKNGKNMFVNLNTVKEYEKYVEEIELRNNHMDITKTIEIKRIINHEQIDVLDVVVVEHNMTIFINDEKYVSIMCTPDLLEELTYGFLYSEGLIKTITDISEITFNECFSEVYVIIKQEVLIKHSNEKLFTTKTITTSGSNVRTVSSPPRVVNDNDQIVDCNYEYIMDNMDKFLEGSQLFNDTGAVHSCALYDINNMIIKIDDVGRHNTLDKVIGYCLKNNVTLRNKILVISGRVSSEMALKVIKIQIPILVSRACPTDLAVKYAKQHGLKLCGFARGNKINIYN